MACTLREILIYFVISPSGFIPLVDTAAVFRTSCREVSTAHNPHKQIEFCCHDDVLYPDHRRIMSVPSNVWFQRLEALKPTPTPTEQIPVCPFVYAFYTRSTILHVLVSTRVW